MNEFNQIKKRFEFAKTDLEIQSQTFKDMEYLISVVDKLKSLISPAENMQYSYAGKLLSIINYLDGV